MCNVEATSFPLGKAKEESKPPFYLITCTAFGEVWGESYSTLLDSERLCI